MIPDGNIICVGACLGYRFVQPTATRRIILCRGNACMAFGVAAWGLSRSCRGDWKVARNTNHAKTQNITARGCRHIYVISGRTAGELPLAPTLPVWIVIDNAL